MARRFKSKYQLPGSRGQKGPDGYFWLVILAMVAAAALIWYPRHPHRTIQVGPLPPNIDVFTKPAVVKPVVPAPPPEAGLPQPPVVVTPAHHPVPETPIPSMTPTNTRLAGMAPTAASSTTIGYPRPVLNPFEAQVELARLGISSGSIDGAMGSQTRLALREFQQENHLPATGVLDAATRALLKLDAPPLTTYTVTEGDLARLHPLGKTWLEKSEEPALDYETEVELVGEFSHSHPATIRQLNPQVNWTNLIPGIILHIPDVQYPDPADKAAWVVIHLSGKYLEAFDDHTNLELHCPCSIAAHVEKRPVGLLHVVVVAPHPNYTFDPAVFPESPEAQKVGHKLILPPGPNNPVGVAWMGLDRPGYGMHGTPAPEQVGRTESHGCFRLANWDAEYLVKLVWIGMPVEVEP